MTFPLVRCDRHNSGEPQPGYCVCVHVLDEGATIAHIVEASARELGEVLCAACTGTVSSPAASDLRLICAQCVDQLYARRGPIA